MEKKDNPAVWYVILFVVILILICSALNLVATLRSTWSQEKLTDFSDDVTIIEMPAIPMTGFVPGVTLQDDETLEVVITVVNAPNREIEFRCPVCGEAEYLCVPAEQIEGTWVCDDCGAQLHWMLREADGR